MNPSDGTTPLAVIIPTLNEESALGATLESLFAQTHGDDRVLVADGGSTDGTLDIARSHGAVCVPVSRRGRGCQIAEALKNVDDEIVLIVHADMIVPQGALRAVRKCLDERPDCPGGCLGHRFEPAGRLLRLTEWWDERRARGGMSYGDQGQFFRRALLAAHGGFPDQPIMEDVELSRRLRTLGRPVYADLPVTVSSRRFSQRGWFRTIVANFWIRAVYRLGGPQRVEAVYRRYYRARSTSGS